MKGAAIFAGRWIAVGRRFGRAIAFAATALIVGSLAAPLSAATSSNAAFPLTVSPVKPGEKMLVESDQMVYDYDKGTVSAVGNVKIYYGGYTLEAERVSYNKTSGRLIAFGHVKLVDPTGAAFYSEQIDITDDFRDGFVQSLRVDTAQRTHFAAERAERSGGDTTTFTNGVYTACEPCKDAPEKPLLWNVKAAKIVVNQKEQMIYFTDAKLEFFGMPVMWLPYFALPDPSISRKSGFLAPSFGYSAKLGMFASLPYYWAVAPNADLTVTTTALSRQGVLGQAEWRHRLENGEYSIQMAGIYQADPLAFNAGSPGRTNLRAGVNTRGEFYVGRDWTLGWDGTLTTDRTFTRDYGVLSGGTAETISTVHLTGLRDRNFFEARASYFQILTDQSASGLLNPAQYNQARQATVAVIDGKKYADQPVLGGELSFTSNLVALTRDEDDNPYFPQYYQGTAGTYLRATKQMDWQRRFIGPLGQVITPFAYLRGDAIFLSGQSGVVPNLTSDSSAYRLMPAVGVDWSLPILAQTATATHIIEPRAQLIVRPDEMAAGTLPNNDAQSLVYDVSTLFQHDKFSGFDRIEGGTRLNLGVHYNGKFSNGASIDATIGQSYQLAGVNPYAKQDIAGVGGPVSGLDTAISDYVAGATIDTGLGPRIAASGRFDEKDFNINRGEIEATAALGAVTASAGYLYLRNNPNSGVTKPASVFRGAASVNLADNWRAFGTMTYDIAGAQLASNSLGIAFDNECLTFSIAYNEIRDSYTDLAPSRWVNFRLQLRTIGEQSVSSNLNKISN
jgi:LPS-assembly protein